MTKQKRLSVTQEISDVANTGDSPKNEGQVYFVNTVNPPLQVKHICYFTRGDGEKFVLYEVVEEYFPHPDAPDDAMVQCLKVYNRDEKRITSIKSGPLVQSWGAENTLRLLYPVTSTPSEK